MADAGQKKVYSIFQQRPKPPAAAAPPPAPPATHDPAPPPPAPLAAATAPELAVPAQKKPAAPHTKAKKQLDRTASASSRATTPTNSIVLSDDDETDGSATATGSRSNMRSKKAVADKPKAKKKKKVVKNSDDEVEIVEPVGAKKKRGKAADEKKEKHPETPKKKKKGKKRDGDAGGSSTIDLTLSPSRPSASSSSLPTSTGFTPLAETYKKDRERRKANEGNEARWPTREEHGDWVVERSEPTEAQKRAEDMRRKHRAATKADQKGKGKAREDDEGDFLATYLRKIESSSAGPSSSASPPTHETRPLASVPLLVPSFPPHPLLNRLAAPLQFPSSSSSPVFSRPGDPGRPAEDKLWTVKYGPQKAEEVLGAISGGSAMHLREWLEELKVQSAHEDAKAKKRRRPINRGVTKPKKKKKKHPKGMDDFLASESEDEDDAGPADLSGYYDLDDFDPPASSSADKDDLLPSRPSTTSVFPSLTNLLLLSGPHGSGKTSTVHAVASELGYEVFEVSPGMGKRRMVDLERYVGDVGKNHLVTVSPRKGNGGMVNLFSMFGKQAEKGKGKKKDEGGSVGANGGEVEMKDAAGKEKGPTQSLILFDEVDVLYAQEHDFWQGVVSLTKESHRPIIMTCTDPSLIPFPDLALQSIVYPSLPHLPPQSYLDFAPPEPALAVPYLHLVALLEGHILPSSAVSELYEQFSPPRPYPPYLVQAQPGERPLPHPKAQVVAGGDLRKALMRLEGELAWRSGSSEDVKEGETRWQVGGLRSFERYEGEVEEEAEGKKDEVKASLQDGEKDVDILKKLSVATEALSAADALIDRRIRVLLGDDDTGRFTTSSDLELSHPLLEPFTPRSAVDNKRGMLPFLGDEPVIAYEVGRLSRRVWKDGLNFGEREDEDLAEKRASFCFSLAQLTQFQGPENSLIHPPWAPLLPHPVSSIFYRPFLRFMTLTDDAYEAAAGLSSSTTSAAGDGGGGGGGVAARVRRSTRHAKEEEKKYRRKLPWQNKSEADWLRKSGFSGMEEEDKVVLPPQVEAVEQEVVLPASSPQGEPVQRKIRTIEDDEE